MAEICKKTTKTIIPFSENEKLGPNSLKLMEIDLEIMQCMDKRLCRGPNMHNHIFWRYIVRWLWRSYMSYGLNS